MTQKQNSTRPLLAFRTGFWVVALGLLLMMAFATLPTPLYSLYQARDGFSMFTITIIFAAYAIGVILALNLAGHLSDRYGRRRMLLIAVGVEAASAALFLLPGSLPILIAARFVSGVAVGLLTATATAGLTELHLQHAGEVGNAPTVATVANLGGLALGPVIGGAISVWAPSPLATPFAAFLGVLIVFAALLAFVPETVTPPTEPAKYRPQRISIPKESRGAFWAAGMAAFACFAVTGFYSSISPTFLTQISGVTDRLAVGLVTFGVLGMAAIAPLFAGRMTVRTQVLVGTITMLVGLLSVGLAAVSGLLALFAGGGVVAGFGVGLIFRSATATAGSLASDSNQSEVLAGVFLLAYAGMTIPPVLIGLALLKWNLAPVVAIFAVLECVLIAVTGAILLRRDRRASHSSRREVVAANASGGKEASSGPSGPRPRGEETTASEGTAESELVVAQSRRGVHAR